MTMYLCDCWHNAENTELSTLREKGRVIENPAYVPSKGDRINLGYVPGATVKEVCYDYAHGIILVLC